VEEQIEFIHNTFKEYLAADRWVGLGESAVLALAVKAAEPAWQPVLRFAALRAQPDSGVADKLVEAVLREFPDSPPSNRAAQVRNRPAHLLVVQIGAVAGLSPRLQERILKLRKEFLPPATFSDAEAIAACEDAVVPYLRYRKKDSTRKRAACVRALGMMQTEAAGPALDEYVVDESSAVLQELARYRNPLSLPAVQQELLKDGVLPGWCPRERVEDLSPIAGLVQLHALDLTSTSVHELGPVRGLRSLHKLDVEGTQVRDISVARHLLGRVWKFRMLRI
jgi:hypothetical protein